SRRQADRRPISMADLRPVSSSNRLRRPSQLAEGIVMRNLDNWAGRSFLAMVVFGFFGSILARPLHSEDRNATAKKSDQKSPAPPKTVPGPEQPDLVSHVSGYVLTAPRGANITAIHLPSLKETIVRPEGPKNERDSP